VVAAVTAPIGAAAVAVAGAAPAESAMAAAARAARVFLLWLHSGRPRLWDTGGVTFGSFTLFLLPSGRPCFRPLDPPGPLVLAPPRAPIDDMAETEAS
jgi:hypothetical protein